MLVRVCLCVSVCVCVYVFVSLCVRVRAVMPESQRILYLMRLNDKMIISCFGRLKSICLLYTKGLLGKHQQLRAITCSK